jgi:hypothetical protein
VNISAYLSSIKRTLLFLVLRHELAEARAELAKLEVSDAPVSGAPEA